MQDARRNQGDGGLIIKSADGPVIDASWKAKCFLHGPVERGAANPKVRAEELPERWYAIDFDELKWDNAVGYAEVRVQPKEPFYQKDFKTAKWIWTSDLDFGPLIST